MPRLKIGTTEIYKGYKIILTKYKDHNVRWYIYTPEGTFVCTEKYLQLARSVVDFMISQDEKR